MAFPFVTAVPQVLKHMAGHEIHRLRRAACARKPVRQEDVANLNDAMFGRYAHVRGMANCAIGHGICDDEGQRISRTAEFVEILTKYIDGRERTVRHIKPEILAVMRMRALEKTLGIVYGHQGPDGNIPAP